MYRGSTLCFVFKGKQDFKQIESRHSAACLSTRPRVSKVRLRLVALLILFLFKTKGTSLKHAAGFFLVKYAIVSFYPRSRSFSMFHNF